ncbi:bacterial regulatory helix-turn-helix, lysR family protein, partial [Vibrio parahaemolyticus V-223/04]
GQ